MSRRELLESSADHRPMGQRRALIESWCTLSLLAAGVLGLLRLRRG